MNELLEKALCVCVRACKTLDHKIWLQYDECLAYYIQRENILNKYTIKYK